MQMMLRTTVRFGSVIVSERVLHLASSGLAVRVLALVHLEKEAREMEVLKARTWHDNLTI